MNAEDMVMGLENEYGITVIDENGQASGGDTVSEIAYELWK